MGDTGGVGGGLHQGLGGRGSVMSVCVVSLNYLCRWQVQVSVYCARPKDRKNNTMKINVQHQ